eukprot:CAMPEP_0114532428 /NCGR_PEP_ID=MMETSP0109-20121206/26662_1 /TAXON_ID=29199 /ORGANISM="Chlorarachnion reptans, Strain CCCM449" /LENGTH=97 /DNA_ID=CAMNT_0001715495 /DNA_START=220 /DNA_END=513 /DNA_ORIENTATION=+
MSETSPKGTEPHPASPKPEEEKKKTSLKVTVHFRAAGGNTPILKRKKFKVNGANQFSSIVAFLRKNLKLRSSDTLYLYCAQAFSPSPEEVVQDLFSV